MSGQDERPDDWPFTARVVGGSPGSPPQVSLRIALAGGFHGGRPSAMRLAIPFKQAVKMHAQLGAAIEQARAEGFTGEVERGP